jgi:hypothetical protein
MKDDFIVVSSGWASRPHFSNAEDALAHGRENFRTARANGDKLIVLQVVSEHELTTEPVTETARQPGEGVESFLGRHKEMRAA